MTTDPAAQDLGDGAYRVRLSDSGSGRSRWDGIALNRCADDAVEDAQGFFIYLSDLDSGALWSATRQPTPLAPEHYAVTRSAGRVRIQRENHGIASTLTLTVQADGEQRHLLLHNRSDRRRRLQITSCVEVALAPPRADLEHPAFLKLFVQTAALAEGDGLIAQRRPRFAGESWPTLRHRLHGARLVAFESDRLRFIGRGRSLRRPAMPMTGSVGNVLDPVLSLRAEMELGPGESGELCFSLEVLNTPAAVQALRLLPPSPPSAPASAIPASGFSEDGSAYRIRLPWQHDALSLPPMPWINVLANESFGCIVSERGAGCTWSRNSQAHRLTPWSNDPVCDPHGEAYYLRDEVSGDDWSPLPGPTPAPVRYTVEHGFGYTRFDSATQQLAQTVTVFVAANDPLKFVRLQLKNDGAQPRRLSLFGYQQLVLGVLPGDGAVRTWREGDVLCANNAQAGDFADGIAFSYLLGEGESAVAHCCDRASFIGAGHSVEAPQALRQAQLDGRCGVGLDPCFAQQLTLMLAPGEQREWVFVLGEAVGEAQLRALTTRYASLDAVAAAYREVTEGWRQRLGGVHVETPSPEIDHMLNGWLPYQAMSSRIHGRTAYYQSSGAYGFRDQLQDAGNLSLLWPQLTRQQLLRHARQQFVEGDVLHWWHDVPLQRGLRTRFADDLLWLPFVAQRYVAETGDEAVFDERLPFLRAPLLAVGEAEAYLKPEVDAESASLYEHCCR